MAKNFRVKCTCGAVLDVNQVDTCPKCGAAIDLTYGCGYAQIYRMGNPFGAAAQMGIYIDDQPYGFIGNTQQVIVPIAYGHHKIHMAFRGVRKYTTYEFDVSPEQPVACVKAHVRVGFWANTVVVEGAAKESMPELK